MSTLKIIDEVTNSSTIYHDIPYLVVFKELTRNLKQAYEYNRNIKFEVEW